LKIKKDNTSNLKKTENRNTSADTQYSKPPMSADNNKSYLLGVFALIIIIILAFTFFFINSRSKVSSVQINSSVLEELKKKELELKEREINLREKEYSNIPKTEKKIETPKYDVEEESIRNVVNSMIQAWQSKDLDGFFDNLTYDYRYESIEGVTRTYDQRLSKAYEIFANNSYIKMTIWNMEINRNGNYAEVKYRQKYNSTTVNDTTTKKLFLRKENNLWKVYKELSGFN
jgi:hypothetical protein